MHLKAWLCKTLLKSFSQISTAARRPLTLAEQNIESNVPSGRTISFPVCRACPLLALGLEQGRVRSNSELRMRYRNKSAVYAPLTPG